MSVKLFLFFAKNVLYRTNQKKTIFEKWAKSSHLLLQFLFSLTSMDSSMVQWKIPQFSTRALSPSNAWRWVLEKCRPSASERNCISFHPTSGAKWVTLTVGDSDDFFPKGRWQQQDDSGNYPWQDKVVREGAGQEMGRVNSGEDVLKMPLTIHIFSQNIGNQYSDISGGKSLWEK